ncbi:hypothetical protein Slin14017_G057580 [Septoria linicola]|nr:hypothetical protein Slin14017_G057580 [Septoria linicola]
MADELAFISYSNERRHLDARTLSRIRSHAQQSVQDQKWSKRTKKANPTEQAAQKAAKQEPQPEFLQLIFDKKSGKEVKRPPTTRHLSNRSVVRRKKSSDEPEQRLVKRKSHSLSASPGERPDPFAAFPVEIDAKFMDLFEGYYQSWKWPNQSRELMFKETMWSPALTHSYLAIANQVWSQDEARSIVHEDQTMVHIAQGLPQLDTLGTEARSQLACALMWSIIRLATLKVNSGQLDASMHHLNALALIGREDWENSRFAPHFQSATASLLLANFHQAGKVKPLLHLPFGPMTSDAVEDVEAEGYEVPEAALIMQFELQSFVQPRVTDALLGLTALYNVCEDDSVTSDGSLPHMNTGKKASQAVKIALRLARYSTPTSSPAETGWDWLADFQECIRLTALLWTWTFGRKVLQNTEAVLSTHRHISRTLTPQLLRKVLDKCNNNVAMVDLLTWMLIVIGSATTSITKRQFYASLLRAIFPGATNTSYGQIRRLGLKLPWIELSSDSPTEDFWHVVRSRSTVIEIDEQVDHGSAAAPLLLGYARLATRSRTSPPEHV